MKFTLSWLKKFLQTDLPPEEIIEGLTNIGLEVEEVINQGEMYKAFIIAEIISTTQHLEADKLRVCQVNTGKEVLQIVCGASNARAGIKVVLAPVGAEIPSNGLKIKESKIRNVASYGMLCSGAELGLTEDSDGIIELSGNYQVGDSFATSYGLDEIIIEISITPNRGDCFGVYGIARDLAAAGYGTLKSLDIIKSEAKFDSPINVEIFNLDLSPRYIGRYFRNIVNQESPIWLKQLLKSIDQKSISALVDITNYFTIGFGRPLHVFDADKISNIAVRKANSGEEFTALNDKNYKLSGEELVIASGDKVIALAGIIGEKDSGVSLLSKNIFLEIGLFDSNIVTKASRLHQIETDAKARFERNIDHNFMDIALELATNMILEICGGEASRPVILGDYTKAPTEINFPLASLSKIIGIEYNKKRVEEILVALGFKVKDLGEDLHLIVPSWRHDITNQEDIVEEIARVDGYNKIPAIPMLNIEPVRVLDAKQQMIYRLRRFPASLGMDEVFTWSFMNSQKAELFSKLQSELFIKNPISSELNYMRPSILPNLLEIIVKNNNRGLANLALFELGSIFNGINPEQQKLTLTGLRSGLNHSRDIYHESRNIDLFDSKADCFKILAEAGIDPSKLQYGEAPSYFHPGRSGALKLGKLTIAYFGELHPKIIQVYDLKNNVVAFELFLDNIPISKPKFGRKGVVQSSDFQAVERDFAFVVNQEVAIDRIVRIVEQCDKKLIKQVNIFDIYQGKSIEDGKKSVAFSVIIQASDHTLTEQEIDLISQKIIVNVVNDTQGVLRAG